MRGIEIVNKVRDAKRHFGPKCPKKFGGAAAVEILRDALAKEGFPTSRRDVFIRGIPIEVDVIIPLRGAKPVMGLLYEPEHVAVVLEVKKSGIFGEQALKAIRANFKRLRRAGIRSCAYVTFEDRFNYKWKGTCQNLGCDCFTLAWHRQTDGPLERTGDWEKFVSFLRKATVRRRRACQE